MSDPVKRSTFYGRRQGRPLRKKATELVETVLPKIQITLDDPENITPYNLDDMFGRSDHETWLEIGFGGGEHLAWQAERNPDVNLIGAEYFINGVASLLGHLDDNGAGNVRIYRGDVRDMMPFLPKNSLSKVFILFPDPWHKARHNKRRIVQIETLDLFADLLVDGGELRMATDDMGYLQWMLERTVPHPLFDWQAESKDDWSQRTDDWPKTRYEEKALKKGLKPGYLRFKRVPRT
ncbi:tRNA (guanine-N7)-methyltransferase [Kiloniella spongiae]|uniref:tRNA (guanine-N(7)-)-methyltransferase n=1 Tax=Kiloniella spongiae TaxID=1489064 RepID=A0A0H2MEL3_9PROT|nr:tRNA (guanosine(46)-N7)-methyltransferase TrmB [Kiloniella spongiae]KLN60959.1 tRNA (guanine-N7)-methyltransferase [Kiloniella spongiae]